MRFKTGDLVFAKVRGYPAWPAKVTCADVPGGGERYSVVFFGTDEFANLSAKNLLIFNNVFKNKFATKNHMKKAAFARAMLEIEKEFAGITLNHGKDVDNEVQKENDSEKVSKVVSGEMKGNTGKGKMKKVLKQRDTNKDLQEDETNNNKLFREKIVEDGIGFSCRLCEFVSGIKIAAKTHAIQCGKKIQPRRKNQRSYNCSVQKRLQPKPILTNISRTPTSQVHICALIVGLKHRPEQIMSGISEFMTRATHLGSNVTFVLIELEITGIWTNTCFLISKIQIARVC